MLQDCKYLQYHTLIAIYLFLRGIREGIDCFYLTYGCLCSFLKRERLYDSIVKDLAEELSPFFPYSEASNKGLSFYMTEQPELKEARDKDKIDLLNLKPKYDPSWLEKFGKRQAIRKSLKTENISSLPEPYQIDEEQIILDVADCLRKFSSIEIIISKKKT